MRLVGIIGKNVSGKTRLASELEAEGYLVLNFSSVLSEILDVLALPKSRENYQTLGKSLRDAFHPGILAQTIEHRIKDNIDKKIIVTGIRYLSELDMLLSLGATIIGLTASVETRYERMKQRESQKEGENSLSLEQFKEKDQHETEQQIDELLKHSKIKIIRTDGKSLEETLNEVKKIINASSA